MERIQRVNQLIKKELSQIILREVNFPQSVLVTITRVEASRNLIQAKIYISVMPEEQSPQVLDVLAKLSKREKKEKEKELSESQEQKIKPNKLKS